VKRSKPKNIPAPTVGRLSRYLRAFSLFERDGVEIVSSRELATASGLNPEAVRKDLAHFGQFGRRGIGYNVKTLGAKVRNILGVSRPWSVAIVGVGHLGQSLLQYEGFAKAGFRVQAAFDTDPSKIGWELEGVKIQPPASMKQELREKKIKIAILTVPANRAQRAAEELTDAGIKAILNFTPAMLNVPPSVLVRAVDMASEMEQLTYFLDKKK
jgi:redox-sensing transcriptional repressor